MYAQIQKIDRSLATIERWLVIALTSGIACIMTTQVFMRYFLSAPLFWAEEISVQLLVFATLFGLSLLVHHSQLVSIDFLPQALPERMRHLLLALAGVVMLGLFAFLCWLGVEWVSRPDVRMELGATTQLPRWYNYSVLPAAMATMTLHQFAAVLRETRAAFTGAAR